MLDPTTICPCLCLSSIYHGDFVDAEDDLKNALESFESKIAMTEAEGAISRLASEVQRAKQRFEGHFSELSVSIRPDKGCSTATNEGRVRIDQLLWATSAIFEIAQVPKSEPREAVDIALFQTAADALRDLSKARARFKVGREHVRACTDNANDLPDLRTALPPGAEDPCTRESGERSNGKAGHCGMGTNLRAALSHEAAQV